MNLNSSRSGARVQLANSGCCGTCRTRLPVAGRDRRPLSSCTRIICYLQQALQIYYTARCRSNSVELLTVMRGFQSTYKITPCRLCLGPKSPAVANVHTDRLIHVSPCIQLVKTQMLTKSQEGPTMWTAGSTGAQVYRLGPSNHESRSQGRRLQCRKGLIS
jgi:hypothetical protein